MTIDWKLGVEMELMAPRGRTRAELAARVAAAHGGTVHRYFHPQSEPSAVPGSPVFENLTLGFEVRDAAGAWIARFVDDLTLQADLDRDAPPESGWYRIVGDDARLLRLAARHCDAGADMADVLDPLAALFGTPVERHDAMVRVGDARDAPVAIAAPLPGERTRPCEIVTAPIEREHHAVLADLLGHARALGFTVPAESATHLHFDAAPLCDARTFALIVAAFQVHGDALKALVGTNPRCTRLGCWPDRLFEIVMREAFQALDWPAAREALKDAGLTKYCDYNLVNMVWADPAKHTFEVRVLPGTMDAAEIAGFARLFAAVLHWCVAAARADEEMPDSAAGLIGRLPLTLADRAKWLNRSASLDVG